jgi:hypothetical protein
LPDIPTGGRPPVPVEFGSLEWREAQMPDDSLAWNLIAFGERHPTNERTRNVYERAHKRLHGRYP